MNRRLRQRVENAIVCPAASLATSVPVMPIATPMFACGKIHDPPCVVKHYLNEFYRKCSCGIGGKADPLTERRQRGVLRRGSIGRTFDGGNLVLQTGRTDVF